MTKNGLLSQVALEARCEDEEQRRQRLELKRAYYATHKIKINARVRLRWTVDPKYRQKCRVQGRRHQLKGRYGISEEDYNAIFVKQNGACTLPKVLAPATLTGHCCGRGLLGQKQVE